MTHFLYATKITFQNANVIFNGFSCVKHAFVNIYKDKNRKKFRVTLSFIKKKRKKPKISQERKSDFKDTEKAISHVKHDIDTLFTTLNLLNR